MSDKHSSIGLLAGIAILIAAPILYGALPVPSPKATLYVSDMTANTVYAVSPAGVKSPFVSCGTCQPEGLAFDAAGNLYVADFNNGTIFKYSATGALINANFITGLSLPVGIAFDAAGNLYVADFGTGTIKKFGPTGGAVPLTTFGAGLQPYGLAFDAAGILYEADFNMGPNGVINRFTTAGTALPPFITGLDYPKGLAFDAAGDLYVSQGGPQDVEKFSPTGAFISVFADGFDDPFGLAFDAAGNLDVVDYNAPGTVTKFGSSGTPRSTFVSGLQNPTFLVFSPVTSGGFFQVHYASNLVNGGDAVINITNTGASSTAVLTPGQIVGGVNQNNINGDICVNVYTFAADEQEVACCSCLVTPNALWSASVKTALLNSTLTPAFPNEVVVKLISSSPIVNGSTQVESCNPATLLNDGALIKSGVMAWGTSLHGVPTATGPTFQLVETPFSTATLTIAELTRDVQECQFIQVLGSGQFGICKGCSNVGLGAAAQ